MKKEYLERLKEGVLLFDGAVGTMLLEKRNNNCRCCEEENLTNPEDVLEIHKAYAAAGAEALTTNSFGANPLKLSKYGLADRTREINIAAVQLAREVAGKDLYVAGSLGPLGNKFLFLNKQDLLLAEKALCTQAAALLEGGVDLLLLETFKNLEELIFAITVIKKYWPAEPLQAQFSLSPLEAGEYLDLVPVLLEKLRSLEGIDVLGVNCSVGPADMYEILVALKKEWNGPVAVMPNAGYPRVIDGRRIYFASPDYFAEYVKRYQEAGAAVIGGCCGTTPQHIRKGAKILSDQRDLIFRIEIDKPEREGKKISVENRGEDSDLKKKLEGKEWIVSVEIIPPLAGEIEEPLKMAEELKTKNVKFINIPDGPKASSRLSSLVTAHRIQNQTGIECIPHLCCRDKNLTALRSDLLGIEALGLRNLLITTGELPPQGVFQDVSTVFDVDSLGLISLTSRLKRGIDTGGIPIRPALHLFLGAVIGLGNSSWEREIERAYRKAEAGTEFFITQPVFNCEEFLFILDKIKGTGLPVLAGIRPLVSLRNAQFFSNEVYGAGMPKILLERMKRQHTDAGAREEGILIARETIETLKPHIEGVVVSAPFGSMKTALAVIE